MISMSKITTVSTSQLMPTLTSADRLSNKLKHQIAHFLAHYRAVNNLQQSDLACKLDVSQGMVSRWESGSYNFSVESLSRTLAALDVDIDLVISSIPPDANVPYSPRSATNLIRCNGCDVNLASAG